MTTDETRKPHSTDVAKSTAKSILSLPSMFKHKTTPSPAKEKESSLKRANADSGAKKSTDDDDSEESEAEKEGAAENDTPMLEEASSPSSSSEEEEKPTKEPKSNTVSDPKSTSSQNNKAPRKQLKTVDTKRAFQPKRLIQNANAHTEYKTARFGRQIEINFKKSGLRYMRDYSQINQVTADCYVPFCATSQVLLNRVMRSAAIIADGARRKTIRQSDVREAWRVITKSTQDLIQYDIKK